MLLRAFVEVAGHFLHVTYMCLCVVTCMGLLGLEDLDVKVLIMSRFVSIFGSTAWNVCSHSAQ